MEKQQLSLSLVGKVAIMCACRSCYMQLPLLSLDVDVH